MVAPFERAFHGWFGPEGVPSSRTGARGLARVIAWQLGVQATKQVVRR
jgi:hypothetical protein